jgi:hypothetical protein
MQELLITEGMTWNGDEAIESMNIERSGKDEG